MKKSIVVGLHLGFWLCYIVLNVVLLYLSLKDEDNATVDHATVRSVYFSLVPSILSFYAFYFVIFRYVKKRKLVLSILYALSIATGAALFGNLLICTFMGPSSLFNAKESMSTGIVFVSFVNLVVGIVALVTRGFISWFNELKLQEEMRQKNHEMEMSLIKAQLDPHFLFNTLNNIDILILKNAKDASSYLNKLSDIMRFMLFETKSDKIFLAKEIEYVEKYIALQKIRTSNSNYINFEVNGTSHGILIAPMVFIPFIENAFKHTSNKKLDNAIKIRIDIKEDLIKLVCENKFNPNRKSNESHGLGNHLIERRLRLIYPENHSVKIEKEHDKYTVELEIWN